MKLSTKIKLMEAWMYCENKDKSTEFMLQLMQDEAQMDLDGVMEYLARFKGQGIGAAINDIYMTGARQYLDKSYIEKIINKYGSAIKPEDFLLNFMIYMDKELLAVKIEKRERLKKLKNNHV